MVDKNKITESIERSILRYDIENIVVKKFVELIKCSSSSATRAGEGAVVHMADDPDGLPVPKRHLQHKGFSEDGEDLGYIADISYPSGFKIDYYHGLITLPSGESFQMGFDDNYKLDANGNYVHDKKGSAEDMFDYQYKEASSGRSGDRQFLLRVGQYFKSGSLQRAMMEMDKRGVNLDRRSVKAESLATNPRLGKALIDRPLMASVRGMDFTRVDGANIAVGMQLADRDISSLDANHIGTRSNVPMSSSVGFLNDKTINARNSVTGEVRSLTGHVNNWDNTWKVYTVVSEGDGTHGLYLGYPQNVKAGSWDNSGNPYNDLTFVQGQQFNKLLVDKKNRVIIQAPDNSVYSGVSDRARS